MDKTLLSDLCTICRSEKPRYRCPRCKTQTCSLPCSKRHKQRASCSGKRDPASYVKKSKWATPTGIDHDYNYLKSVERTIGDASSNAHQRGIGVKTYTSRTADRTWQTGSAFGRYLTEHHINVEHAPMGMSRQKTNQTRTTKSGKVMWTVEWIDESGKPEVQTNCLESLCLAELYAALRTERHNAQKRQTHNRGSDQMNRGVKRKREQVMEKANASLDKMYVAQEAKLLEHIKSEERQHSVKAEPAEHQDPKKMVQPEVKLSEGAVGLADIYTVENAMADPLPAASALTGPPLGDLGSISNDGTAKSDDDVSSDGSTSPVHIITERKDESSFTQLSVTPISSKQAASSQHKSEHTPALDFYLLKPATRSASLVLIPLEGKDSLTVSLRSRTVQEYPTIYVLSHPPELLGSGFLLEADYLKSLSEDYSTNDMRPDVVTNSSACRGDLLHHDQPHDDKPLDAKSILEMLKRDIKR